MPHLIKEIPDGWQMVKLGDIGEAIIGLTYSPKDVVSAGGMLVLRSSNIKDGKICYDDQVLVTTKVKEKLILREGDILICSRNGSRNLIGKNVYIEREDAGNTFGAFMTVYRTNIAKYAKYLFQSNYFMLQIRKDLGPTINQVTTGNLNAFKFCLPSNKEQDRIVAALETWDEVIEKISKRIKLKEEVMNGLMQTLLTGKKRLVGFDGEWKTVQLAEVGKFRGGNGFPEKYQGDLVGKYPFYKVSDMNNLGNEVYMSNSNNWVTDVVRNEIKSFVFPKNTIVLAKIGAALFLERKRILGQESCLDNNMMGFIVNSHHHGDFMYYKFLKIQFGNFANTTALPSLSGSELSEIEVDVPTCIAEEIAIATILKNADEEITVLKKKLSLFTDQKKYLLNNLVTCNMRTPEKMVISRT